MKLTPLLLLAFLPACVVEDVPDDDGLATTEADLTGPCCSTAPAVVTWDRARAASFVKVDYADLTASDVVQQVRGSTRATLPRCSGKWYWEIAIEDFQSSGQSYPMIGVGTASASLQGDYIGGDAQGWSYYPADARKYHDARSTGYTDYGDRAGPGDVIGVALDLDNRTLTFYKNGVSQGRAFDNLPAGVPLYPMLGTAELYFSANARFSGPFQYAPPAGFAAYGGAPITRWNQNARASFVTLAHADVTASDTLQQVRGSTRATRSRDTGKWYWEIRIDDFLQSGFSYPMLGVGNAAMQLDGEYIGGTADGWSDYPANARKYHDARHGGWADYGARGGVGDVIGVAMDADAHKLTFYRNGVTMTQAFGDLSPGTALYPMLGTAELYFNATARFAAPFDYPAPADYAPFDGTVARCSN